jgi:hypothetical protein
MHVHQGDSGRTGRRSNSLKFELRDSPLSLEDPLNSKEATRPAVPPSPSLEPAASAAT